MNHIKATTNKEYNYLTLKYRQLLNYFIMDKLELKKYDRSILISDLMFKKIDKDKMDLYQYAIADELEYLYIRNDIYIDNLNKNEIELLKKIECDEFIQQCGNNFIENTFQRVIIENYSKGIIGHTKLYGPNSSNYMAPNNSIIIGIRYDDYYTGDFTDEKWGILREKQLDFLDELKIKIVNEQKQKLNNKLVIIHYDDFSIMNI